MPSRRRVTADEPQSTELRIIGGALRGRRIRYSGDPRTRPMKDRVREAVFNLVGPEIVEAHAVDLFAGSGAIGFEALSRGAAFATFLEKHFPTAKLIRDNLRQLALEDRAAVLPADTLIHFRRRVELPEAGRPVGRWVVFCSPPFDFYVDRQAELLKLLADLDAAAPPTSLLVVEADQRFDPSLLPNASGWRVRAYPPAVVAIYRKPQ